MIIGISLFLIVQAHNVYPDLLLLRIFFSIGAAASSCMVTAILPSVSSSPQEETHMPRTDDQDSTPVKNSGTSQNSESSGWRQDTAAKKQHPLASSSRLAGIVGFVTGLGALLALLVFLRLPGLIQRVGVAPSQALKESYYVVGAYSIILSLICFSFLSHLPGDGGKGWRSLFKTQPPADRPRRQSLLLLHSVRLGFNNRSLGLAYLGGFVARASSVGISTFIPLHVNTHFISSGLCNASNGKPEDVKEHCRQAYTLAAQLTGISQTAALVFALVFGFCAEKYRQSNVSLVIAALVGLVGYFALGYLNNPMPNWQGGTPFVYIIMIMLGFSQIGIIVCSLSLLWRCVLETNMKHTTDRRDDDSASLLPKVEETRRYEDMKGEIAGVYSLAGGIGILVLSKVGGLLFDRISTAAPFHILASFNALLLISALADAVISNIFASQHEN